MRLDDLYQTDVEFWKQLPTEAEAKQHAAYMEEAEAAVDRAHRELSDAKPEAVAFVEEVLVNDPRLTRMVVEYLKGDPYYRGTLTDLMADAMSRYVESKL